MKKIDLKDAPIKSSYLMAGGIAIFLVLWMASGYIGSDSAISAIGEENTIGSPETEALAVRAKVSKAQVHSSNLILRGRSQASRVVIMRSETVGRVIDVPAQEGARINEGDVICELAMNARQAMYAQAEANLRQRELELKAAKSLLSKGHRSETQEAAAQAAYDAAQAALEEITIEIEHTKIRAPFDGVLDKRNVEVGDYMSMGDPCATVMDPTPFRIVGQVSEKEVMFLKPGMKGFAKLVTGDSFEGELRFVSNVADPATRTFRIELEVPNESFALRDGVTAEIHIPFNSIRAHLLAPSVLVLNEAGQIGVRIAREDDTVQFVPVEILADTEDGVWLGGLPEQITVITVGQDYVGEGQKVMVVLPEEETTS